MNLWMFFIFAAGMQDRESSGSAVLSAEAEMCAQSRAACVQHGNGWCHCLLHQSRQRGTGKEKTFMINANILLLLYSL